MRPAIPHPHADEIRMRAVLVYGVFPFLLSGLSAAQQPDAFPAPRLLYVHYANLRITTPGGNDATTSRLWVSTDRGRTWYWTAESAQPECGTTPTSSPSTASLTAHRDFEFLAPRDERYEFCILPADQSPNEQTTPSLSVVVDTTPPTLQIQSLQLDTEDASGAQLVGRLTLIEEHLSPLGVRLFHRAPGERIWVDGGVVAISDRQFRWRIPATAPPRADIRLVATDLAGNQTHSQRSAVSLRSHPKNAASQPATQPAAASAIASETESPLVLSNPHDPASIERLRRAAEMHNLARVFEREGRFDLAAARFADAASLRSEDADLLAEWGRALLELDAVDDAEQRFADALRLHAGQLDALNGLGEIANRRGRYREAFELLRRLANHRPDSPELWLKLGDAAGRAGDTAEARRAWKKAADSAPPDSAIGKSALRRLQLIAPQAN